MPRPRRGRTGPNSTLSGSRLFCWRFPVALPPAIEFVPCGDVLIVTQAADVNLIAVSHTHGIANCGKSIFEISAACPFGDFGLWTLDLGPW